VTIFWAVIFVLRWLWLAASPFQRLNVVTMPTAVYLSHSVGQDFMAGLFLGWWLSELFDVLQAAVNLATREMAATPLVLLGALVKMFWQRWKVWVCWVVVVVPALTWLWLWASTRNDPEVRQARYTEACAERKTCEDHIHGEGTIFEECVAKCVAGYERAYQRRQALP